VLLCCPPNKVSRLKNNESFEIDELQQVINIFAKKNNLEALEIVYDKLIGYLIETRQYEDSVLYLQEVLKRTVLTRAPQSYV
jgi:hypothetical protein